MVTTDPRFDEYIERAPAFAVAILERLRKCVHTGCPDAVESMKWSRLAFEYKGVLCGMSAFKKHFTFGFWRHALLVGKDGGLSKAQVATLERLGRLEDVSELPSDKDLIAIVKKAVALHDAGIKPAASKRAAPSPDRMLAVPPDLAKALKKSAKAKAAFDGFSYSHRKEYVEWITEAKQAETRERRLLQAIEMLSEGKSRHWKYQKG